MGNSLALPYFWSAQLDGALASGNSADKWEGWFGFIVCNFAVWMTIVVLDLHLLVFEFKEVKSQSHMLQTGAVTAAATAAGTMVLFSLFHYGDARRPFSSEGDEEARLLPPFATALITGGLRATLGFTYLLVLLAGIPHETVAYKILLSQIGLKHLGVAMALANQRLAVYTNLNIVSATS